MALQALRHFLKLEATGGILLFIMALVAFAISNSPFSASYQAILEYPLNFKFLFWELNKPLLFWINEGLMTLFFLMIGLELKREFVIGDLTKLSQVMLPGIAALGGMLVPAAIYTITNWGDTAALRGWAIPVATDIAFSLGVLSLFGKRVPAGLKLFLMALAIFDDVGAILIIAMFHTHSLSFVAMVGAVIVIILLLVLNRLNVRTVWPYLILGFFLWLCVLSSGVHATVAGVLLAFVMPIRSSRKGAISSAEKLESILHPWVAYLIMPVFALANAGVTLVNFSAKTLLHGVTLGVILGLLCGKTLGVSLFSWATIKLKFASLPHKTTWPQLFGVAILCGIGFTMSLFLGTLAFNSNSSLYIGEMRLGVVFGSLFSGILGSCVLFYVFRTKKKYK